jgi:hypothetical protein
MENLREKKYKDLGATMNTEQRELKRLAKALYQRGHVAQAEGVRDLTLIKEAAGPPSVNDLVQQFEDAIAAGKVTFDNWRSHNWPKDGKTMYKAYHEEDVKTWARISKFLRRHYRSYMTQGLDPDEGWDSQTDPQKLESIQKALSGLSAIKEGKHSTRTSYTYYVKNKKDTWGGLSSETVKTKKTGKVINLSDEVTARMASWKKSAPVLWHFVGNAGDAWRSAHRAAEHFYINKIKEDKTTADTAAETEVKTKASKVSRAAEAKALKTQWPGMPGQDGRGTSVINVRWTAENPPKYSGRGRRKKIIKNVAWYQHYAYKSPQDPTSDFGIMRSKLVIIDNDHWVNLGKKLPKDLSQWVRVENTFKKASKRYDLTKYAQADPFATPSGGGGGSSGGAGPFGSSSPSPNRGGGGGGGAKRRMRTLTGNVITDDATGDEFRNWVINNPNTKIKGIATEVNLSPPPSGTWYNKYMRNAWAAVKREGFEYKARGLTTDPDDIAESKAGANIQADESTLKAYLLYKDPLKHRDEMLGGATPPSKHGGPFPKYTTKNLLKMEPKEQAKYVERFVGSPVGSGPLLSAYRADVVGSPSLAMAMVAATADREEAAEAAKTEAAEKAKREKEAVKSADYYIIPQEGAETLSKDSDNNFRVGTIFVSKENGDTYYIGQAHGRPKQLFSLQLRAMGRGGVRGANVLSGEELAKLEKVVPDSHWETWSEFFDMHEQYIESLTESQSGWNPASWFRESRKTEGKHRLNALNKVRELHRERGGRGGDTITRTFREDTGGPSSRTNPFPTPGDGRTY